MVLQSYHKFHRKHLQANINFLSYISILLQNNAEIHPQSKRDSQENKHVCVKMWNRAYGTNRTVCRNFEYAHACLGQKSTLRNAMCFLIEWNKVTSCRHRRHFIIDKRHAFLFDCKYYFVTVVAEAARLPIGFSSPYFWAISLNLFIF